PAHGVFGDVEGTAEGGDAHAAVFPEHLQNADLAFDREHENLSITGGLDGVTSHILPLQEKKYNLLVLARRIGTSSPAASPRTVPAGPRPRCARDKTWHGHGPKGPESPSQPADPATNRPQSDNHFGGT